MHWYNEILYYTIITMLYETKIGELYLTGINLILSYCDCGKHILYNKGKVEQITKVIPKTTNNICNLLLILN